MNVEVVRQHGVPLEAVITQDETRGRIGVIMIRRVSSDI
jgi:hypothetical protein